MYLRWRHTPTWAVNWDATAPNSGATPRRSQYLKRAASSKQTATFVIVGVILGMIVIAATTVVYRRSRRRNAANKDEPNSTPGIINRILNRPDGGRYEAANDEDGHTQDAHQLGTTTSGRLGSRSRSRNRSSSRGTRSGNQPPSTANDAETAVDRNTSVRSIMTLPAYRQTASNNEEVLGREGERDGIDTVVDLPTLEDEEALREEEMEALYQLRLRRREQITEREENRRQRREASERGDSVTLAELRDRQRAANSTNTAAELRAEVERIKGNRQRSVSTVSYKDLGVASHDGTRVRANSNESERIGLLSDAASIAMSALSTARSPGHGERSRTSLISMESDFPSPTLTRSRGDSQPNTPGLGSGSARAGSTPELVEAESNHDDSVPPPEYEDVSLDDSHSRSNLARSTTPINEPPPDYPGPYRADSQDEVWRRGTSTSDSTGTNRFHNRGVGGVPQLPSLRISGLPSIVVDEPPNPEQTASRR